VRLSEQKSAIDPVKMNPSGGGYFPSATGNGGVDTFGLVVLDVEERLALSICGGSSKVMLGVLMVAP
jgi:hypothetical protein